MRSFFVLLLLGVALATIAIVVRSGMLARKNPGRPINSAMRAALETPQFSEQDAAIIDQRYANAHKLPSGLQYVEVARGDGVVPQPGSLLTVSYEGKLLDGTVFDSSPSFRFTLGTGQVIKGWDEAFSTMRKGEKRTLIVPYWLAYGDQAHGKIPARATLIFDVTLLEIR